MTAHKYRIEKLYDQYPYSIYYTCVVCGYTKLDYEKEICTCEWQLAINNSHEWIGNTEQPVVINGTTTIPPSLICKKCGIKQYNKVSYLTCNEQIIKDIIE